MAGGAIAGYAVQVGENRAQGMDWGAALSTNISGEKILAGAVIAGGVVFGAAVVGTVATVGAALVGGSAATACATSNACTGEVALDTNAVIAATEGGPAQAEAVTTAMAGRTPVIPPTVVEEYLKRGSMDVLNTFNQTNNGRIGSIPALEDIQALQQRASNLGRSLKAPDASVAASAIKDGLSLLTADKRLVNTLRDIGVSVEHLLLGRD
jgi:predicted nucleic acid-binding protein